MQFLYPDPSISNLEDCLVGECGIAAQQATGLAIRRLTDTCRYTCSTLLLAAGENPKVVSEQLGITEVAFTLDRHGHVLPGMQEKAAGKLEAILFG